MSFWKSVLFGWMIFLSLFFVSCTKNDTSTIILLGPETYVDDIIKVIPDSLRTVFMQQFGEIPQGYVPPKVEGSYVVAPKRRCGSNVPNWPLNVVEPNMNLRFSNQHNSVVEFSLAEATETFTDTVFLMGYGNKFTVYYKERKEMTINEASVVLKRGIIVKGEMCDEGIRDLYFANIVMDVEGETDAPLVEPGQYFIYKDGDDIAKKEE